MEKLKDMGTLAKDLAELHHAYGIYDGIDNFKELRTKKTNILNFCKEFEELKTFNDFYDTYFEQYDSLTKTSINIGRPNTRQARGIDFPFIGDNVIKIGKAKFMFVFEGSLSNNNENLSVTVLANFWHIEKEKITDLFNKQKALNLNFWNESNFKKVKDQLNLNSKVIDNSFVVDAIRVAKDDDPSKIDIKKNRTLIWKEIELLKPDLVICIGNYAKMIVGMQYTDLQTKFHHIPFPTYRKSQEKNSGDQIIYKELSSIYNKILQ